jgi:autotransporter-associated beta strand protein
LKLNGTNNTYSGGTTVSAGALSIGSTAALPGWNANGTYSVSANATLAVQNAVTDADIATMLGTTNFAAGSFIGFDTSAADRTYSVIIADTAQGSLGLTKVGGNTLPLNATNSYTGGTFVDFGTVAMKNNSAFGTGDVTLDGGAFTGSGTAVTIPNNLVFISLGGSNALSSSTIFAGNVTGAGDFSFNGFTNGIFGFTNLQGGDLERGHHWQRQRGRPDRPSIQRGDQSGLQQRDLELHRGR